MTFARISTVVAAAFLSGLLLAFAWPMGQKISVPIHTFNHEAEAVAQLPAPRALSRVH
jgi:hypothetical protein